MLLVDEAYADFVDVDETSSMAALVTEHENLLVLRTFSKGYSLAGLRLGYLLGDPSLIRPVLEKTRDSYNVDAISQAIGLAAIEDKPMPKKPGPACGVTVKSSRQALRLWVLASRRARPTLCLPRRQKMYPPFNYIKP